MMDDPFVAAWFRGLRKNQEGSYPMVMAAVGNYVKNFGMTVTGRSFIAIERGLLGLAPVSTRPGDVVEIIAGASTPFLLRPRYLP